MNDHFTSDDSAVDAFTAATGKLREAPLPDGIGLRIDDVRTLLAQKHETMLPKDEPMLMMVTMFNAFLAEEEKLLARHGKAMSGFIGDKTDAYVKSVQQATDSLAQSLSRSSADSFRVLFETHKASLEKFRHHLIWTAAIIGVSALVNVVVFVLMGVRHG